MQGAILSDRQLELLLLLLLLLEQLVVVLHVRVCLCCGAHSFVGRALPGAPLPPPAHARMPRHAASTYAACTYAACTYAASCRRSTTHNALLLLLAFLHAALSY